MVDNNEYEADTDATWVVFDRDDHPSDKRDKDLFNQALDLATSNKIDVAYSNRQFELWLLLHFIYIDTAQDKNQLESKLSQHLNSKYNKTDANIYENLIAQGGSLERSIKHAERLLKNKSGVPPADANPSTKVHLLIAELRKEFVRD